MHTRKLTNLAIAASTTALLVLSFPAKAQQQPPAGQQSQPPAGQQYQPPTGQQQAPAAEPVDDETLQKFAVAFADVRDLQQQFARELESVESNEKAREMQQQVQDEMVQAVEENGMTVQEYNEVASQLDRDPELRQRVMDMIGSDQ